MSIGSLCQVALGRFGQRQQAFGTRREPAREPRVPGPQAHEGQASELPRRRAEPSTMTPQSWKRRRREPKRWLAGQGGASCALPKPCAPTTIPATIAAVAMLPPAIKPTAAPRGVSLGHQIPRTNSGQNVLAASAKAHPTRTLMSTLRTTRARKAGPAIPIGATIRNRRLRTAGVGRLFPCAQRSCETVPAIDTSRPEEVDMNAANAPAAVSAPRVCPTVPGQANSGSLSTTVSVCPVMYRLGLLLDRERRTPPERRRTSPGIRGLLRWYGGLRARPGSYKTEPGCAVTPSYPGTWRLIASR